MIDGLLANRVRAEIETDRPLVALDGRDKSHWVIPLAIARHFHLSGHTPFSDRVAIEAVLSPALLVGTAGAMIDPRDPFERLQRRAAGENGLRHLHESLVWHQHSGFEERFQNVQDLEVGSELALDGEGRRRDPAVEMSLRPVPLDCCREPVGAETDDRPGQNREDEKGAGNARKTDRHLCQTGVAR